MKSWLFTCVFVSLHIAIYGQHRLTDSLQTKLKNHPQQDSLRVSLLTQLATEEMYDHPAAAGNYAFEALDISRKIKSPASIALSYRMLGNAFWAQANQSAALDNFLKGIKIADSIHNLQLQADLMGNLGMVYNDISDYDKALQYYKKSLVKQIELKNKLREGITRLNVGNANYHLKHYDSSLIYYHQALAMLVNIKNTRTITDLIKVGIGEALGDMGKYDSALWYLYRAKKSTDTTHHHRGMVHSRITIARIMIRMHHYDVANKELIECLARAKEVHLKTYIRDCYELLATVNEAQGHPAQAFTFFKLYTQYKDSINSSAITSKIASLQLEYEIQRKQMEIDGLTKDSLIKAEELKFKNTLLISALIGIVFIVWFLYYVIRNNKHQRKLNKDLTERNTEIHQQKVELAQQHDEVLTLNEEIRAQKEELATQNDILAEKNRSIEELNRNVIEANENLEVKIALRTAAIREQNKRIEEYAFINAHKLRAPVASILGIINLLQREVTPEERALLTEYLKKSSDELDRVIRAISNTLQQAISTYDNQNLEEDKTHHPD